MGKAALDVNPIESNEDMHENEFYVIIICAVSLWIIIVPFVTWKAIILRRNLRVSKPTATFWDVGTNVLCPPSKIEKHDDARQTRSTLKIIFIMGSSLIIIMWIAGCVLTMLGKGLAS